MKSIRSISVFDTSIATQNIGDEIIMDSVYNELYDILKDDMFLRIPSHEVIGIASLSLIRKSPFAIVGGSNILSSAMNNYKQWRISLSQSFFIKNKVLLLGVGWRNYQTKPNLFTKLLLKQLLNKEYLHSVRDSYTEAKLKEQGFKNVINTSCPTMWRLTPEHCSKIPQKKSDTVVFTLTDYSKDLESDIFLIKTLLESYQNIYYWVQSRKDLIYLNELNIDISQIKIISPSLRAYTNFLETTVCDYVGTRLHGGVRALQKERRTIIIGVDNRAIEKKKDFNLMVIERRDLKDNLKRLIDSELKMDIKIPIANINKWKAQFLK